MESGRSHPQGQGGIEREEVKKAVENQMVDEAHNADGIIGKMLKCSYEGTVEWWFILCRITWKQKLLLEWMKF